MQEYRVMYEKLLEEFETYQNFAENQIQILNEKNIELEKNLDALVNIVEISKYINSHISDDNLIPMINDMIIGILGVTYSSIYLLEDRCSGFEIKATNLPENEVVYREEHYLTKINKENPFVLNSRESIFGDHTAQEVREIHSLIGVPIRLRAKVTGYIMIEHTLWNYFSYEHITFITSIANQIAIAIENNALYKRIQESLKRDSLLNIYNRKYFKEFVKNKIEIGIQKFALVMMDFDDFKVFNDNYGHLYGDEILVRTMDILREELQIEDLMARYGGDEIVLYLKMENENEADIKSRVDNIREKIYKNKIEFNGIEKNTTATFGIAYYPEDGECLTTILNKADQCLYKAKALGRNRVITTRDKI